MNQEKIGSFIAKCRKEKGYTQAGLAEKLGITDRAVSKWENGKSMPDASLMLPLCELLGINVNELLTGEHLTMDEYKENAEENLMMLKEQEEKNNKMLLSLEMVIGYSCTAAYLVLLFAACFAVENTIWRIGLILTAAVLLLIGVTFALKIERDAGYYECPHCDTRYVPTMKAVILAPHWGRNRYMKCPHCGKRGYHKKVLTK